MMKLAIDEHLESFGPFTPDDLLFVDHRTGETPTLTVWRRVWNNGRLSVGVDCSASNCSHFYRTIRKSQYSARED